MSFAQPDYSNYNYFFEPRPQHQPDLSAENAEMSRLIPVLQRIPISSPSFRQAMANVLHHLHIASRALALGCGISSEFRFLPETWGLRELNVVHGHYLVPMSYHLYSAMGAAELLATGQGRHPHFPLAVGCMLAIERLWRNFPEANADLRRAVGPRYAVIVDRTGHEIRQMAMATRQALAISHSTVDPTVWDASVQASHLAYRVREKVVKSMNEEMY